MNNLCIISGPTASGKTSTSIQLAKKFGGEIVNFDSLLLYQELNIGSAKPTKSEMSGVPHHLIGINSIEAPLNASSYIEIALEKINQLHLENKLVFLVGGSGFYLQALLYGMFSSGTTPNDIIEKSNKLYKDQGIEPFIDFLRTNDQESFKRYHQNDHYRIRRAVEHYWHNQTPFSKSRDQMMAAREENSNIKKFKWNIFHIHLDLPKDQHLQIIAKRTSQMLKDGLVSEVQDILNKGHSPNLKPLQSIGYKETIDFIRGELEENDLCDRINISTRQLAKAQRTWFKKINKSTYHPLDDMVKLEEDFRTFFRL